MSGFSTGTAWVIGESTGVTATGTTTSLPLDMQQIGQGAPTPTAAPTGGAPIYRDTDQDNIYIWTGTAWIGPYNKGT